MGVGMSPGVLRKFAVSGRRMLALLLQPETGDCKKAEAIMWSFSTATIDCFPTHSKSECDTWRVARITRLPQVDATRLATNIDLYQPCLRPLKAINTARY